MLAPGSFIAKSAALAILVALLFAAIQFAVQPLLHTYRDNQAKIENSHELLQRYQRLAVEKPRLANQLASLEADVETSAAYLEGSSEALAAAALQDLVADAIEMAGGDVQSLRTLPAAIVEDRPELHRTGVQIRLTADIDGLAEMLLDLETMEPRLFVDRLEVMAAGARRATKNADAAPRLDVRIDIHGYARLQE